jgi:very-short-patch-repair endonuclease
LREVGEHHRFRRQHPIRRYIVDFACPRLKLAIELDGGHALRGEEDAVRTTELASRGYRLIHFWNGDVIDNLAGVVERITSELIALSALEGGEGVCCSRCDKLVACA